MEVSIVRAFSVFRCIFSVVFFPGKKNQAVFFGWLVSSLFSVFKAPALGSFSF